MNNTQNTWEKTIKNRTSENPINNFFKMNAQNNTVPETIDAFYWAMNQLILFIGINIVTLMVFVQNILQ